MATSKSKSKIMRDHELNLALIDLMARDPQAKFFIGASVGLGAVWITSMLPAQVAGQETPGAQAINWYERMLGIGSPLLAATGIFDFNQDDKGGVFGNMFNFATGSYTAFCMANCILMSMNMDENPLVGAITP